MKKILVTGSSGMVGSKFVEIFKDRYRLLTPGINKLDLTEKDAVSKYIINNKPDVIVHFAAYTDVSEAEKQRGDRFSLCWQVNVEGTRNLANVIDPEQTHFIHISTDMVFSGRKDDTGPYEEAHEPENDPEKLTWYGYTKKCAENAVKAVLGDKCSILRLIYPVRTGYKKKLDPQVLGRLKMYDEGKLYPLFHDQYISITDVDEACEAILRMIEGNVFGTFHASSRDISTPYELGSYIIEKARGKKNVVERSSFDEYVRSVGSKVRWPKYGGLKVRQTEKTLGMKFSTWKQIIDKITGQSTV
ncbi:sugar nucleotide-binding protein [Candidatus Woesebacteria bacterium]|nr:sugar nucleotide-binding protein [Candidatus Woesebacteria bacterium]